MTITYAVLMYFAPVALLTAALALIHKHGPGRTLRAIAAVLWALSFACPAAVEELRRVYLTYWRKTMELA